MKSYQFHLTVTRQPAVPVGLLFLMALHTKPHHEALAFDPVHCLHPTVAFLATDFLPDMSLMVEQDVFRQVVDLAPRGGRLGVEIVVFLFDLGMFGNNVLVTVKAFLHRR